MSFFNINYTMQLISYIFSKKSGTGFLNNYSKNRGAISIVSIKYIVFETF